LIAEAHHFDDPDWSLARALAWITLPTPENVEAASRGYGVIDHHAVTKLTSALRLARRGLAATGLFEGEKFARKIDREMWGALKIVIEHKLFLNHIHPDSRGDGSKSSTSTIRFVTVRSKIAQRLEPGLDTGIHRARHAAIDGVTIPRATVMQLFPAQVKRLTAKIETDCRGYLLQLMKDTPYSSPKPKDDIWADCRNKFPGLSRRAFDRQWSISISETGASWNSQGRRKNPAPEISAPK
jgi:hypothetical protein